MVHVEDHSASTKNNPSLLDLCYPNVLKHGNSLLLNWVIKNGWKVAENQGVGAMGNARRPLGFSQLPDKPPFYLMG